MQTGIQIISKKREVSPKVCDYRLFLQGLGFEVSQLLRLQALYPETERDQQELPQYRWKPLVQRCVQHKSIPILPCSLLGCTRWRFHNSICFRESILPEYRRWSSQGWQMESRWQDNIMGVCQQKRPSRQQHEIRCGRWVYETQRRYYLVHYKEDTS